MDFDDIVKIVDQVKVLEARLAAVEAERDAARAERDAARAEAEKEEKDCLQVIAERDEHEERLNRIFAALGMDEAESEWSSANDPAALAIEKAEELRAALLTARAGEARAVEALDVFARAYQVSMLPFAPGIDEADGAHHGWPSVADLEQANAALTDSSALDWLAQQRREAVAAWIEKEATKSRQQSGEYYERSVEGMLEEAAALRAGEVESE